MEGIPKTKTDGGVIMEDLRYFGFDFWQKTTPKKEPVKERRKKIYFQNWSQYNQAKTQEKLMFLKILNDVVESLDIPYPYKGNGRYPHPIQDMIKCCCIKVYCQFSSRKIISDLRLVQSLGYLFKTPHFNSINNYMSSEKITPYLNQLIQLTSEPLSKVETNFAPDATGFSTFNKKNWIDFRLDKIYKKEFRKLHILTGVKSNIVTFAKVTKGTCHDSPIFETLLKNTIYFKNIHTISADSGYLSRKNCDLIASVGARPFIMPKKNIKRPIAKGSKAWYEMIRFWKDNEEEFRHYYNRRSNVESTFSMIKANYLPYVRCKSFTGAQNEALCKVICHNIAVLVSSIFEFGIKLNFVRE